MSDTTPKVKDRVTIHGLSKAPELNGKEGRIISYETESGRFVVKLTGDDRRLKVKPGNLESIPSGSGGGDASDAGLNMNIDSAQMKKASDALGNATPDQLRRQAEMFKNMSKEQMKQLRRQQPQFKNMSDEQIRGMSAQMEEMSKNPAMMKKMSEQMKNMTPEQMKYQAEMMKNMSPQQIKDIEKMQKSMGDPNVDQTALGADMMKNMSPKQLSDMMKMQKEMLKKNPEMVKKMMANNPMMKNISAEQLEQQLDMMADMDPKNLERLMKVTQGVQKMSAPLVKAYGSLNNATGGRANAIILVFCAAVFFYLIDYLFLSSGRVPPTGVHSPPLTNNPLDDFDDDEL